MSSRPESSPLNRRNAIKAFGVAGISALSIQATAAVTAPGRLEIYTYATFGDLRADKGLKAGNWVRTLGYTSPGDGGAAEYLIKAGEPADQVGAFVIDRGLYAELNSPAFVTYRMFGAISDGKNDDGVQIKRAHAYANAAGLPVINQHGEYWIKGTTGIEIKTNVSWGDSIFHIDEKFNNRGTNKFLVMSKSDPVDVPLTPELKSALLEKIRPGVTIIPELALYKNTMMVVSDVNDRIAVRSGAAYNGTSTKAREEFFYIEEHGRILGDIAWGFKDFTKITAYPAEDSYLVVDGGTFYFSGETPDNGVRSYVSIGFRITRSRSVIRNQWVGLEHGKPDVGMAPKNGFYSYNNVYDVLLENVRLIPWEKDRPGTENDVKDGTYGIGGTYVLNATFRNVTAEGSPIHWGVFGTNLFKNFRVEQCVLNRIDVHFYCQNLYIKDTKVGTNGITITGGGDLFVENTTCRSNNFISFRRDFGAKWDGDIRIRNCRLAPTGTGETSILSMTADDTDYKYPIGYGRTVKVEDVVVDFGTVPHSAANSWLMRLSPYSKAAHGGRVFFPSHLEFKNVMVVGREKGMRFIQIPSPQNFLLGKNGGYDGTDLIANSKIILEDIQSDSTGSGEPHLAFLTKGGESYEDAYSLYPDIRISRCGDIHADLNGSIAQVSVNDSKITGFTGHSESKLKGRLTFNNCRFQAVADSETGTYFRLASELGTTLVNCTVLSPVVKNEARPELVNQTGLLTVNKSVSYSHINTRLGNDLLGHFKMKSLKLNPTFLRALTLSNELENS